MRMTIEDAQSEKDGVKDGESFAPRVDEDKKNHWEDLRGQGVKAHWDYFWEYYHIHVIVILALVVFSASFIREIVSRKPYAINAVCINAAEYIDAIPQVSLGDNKTADRFAEYTGIDIGEYDLIVDTSVNISRDNMTQMDVTASEKIFAQVASQDLDAMAADRKTFKSYARSQMFADLREVLDKEEFSLLEEKGLLYYIDTEEIKAFDEYSKTGSIEPFEWEEKDVSEMSDPVPVGLWIKKDASGGALCGVIVNTKRVDSAVAFLRFLVLY